MNSTKKSKKQVTQQLLEFPEPDGDQYVARVVGPAGNNLHKVTRENGEESLCSMPNKFRKNIWIKRGDYVLVDPIIEGNKVTSEISRILLKEHIRHLKLRNLWPSAFADTDDAEDIGDENPGANDGHAAADADSVVPGASEDPGYSAHAPRSVHGDATEASNQGIASISVAAAAANVARLNVEGSGTDSEAVVADGYGNVDYASTDDEGDDALAYLDDVPVNTNRRQRDMSSSEDEYSTEDTDD